MMDPRTQASLLACALLLACLPAQAGLRGAIGAEARLYPESPAFADQDEARVQPSVYLDLQAAGAWRGGVQFDLDLFARAAPREASADVRQATLEFGGDRTEWKVGVLAETWGVLEAWNPVDTLNQRDVAEDFQGDTKLGQPGMVATVTTPAVVLGFYATTYGRARRVAEAEDRLRLLPAPVLDATFERGRWRPSLAARAQVQAGALDVAVSHYSGLAQEPLLLPEAGANGLRGFHAVYERLDQSGLEFQYVAADSVLKAEVIHRDTGGQSFWGGGAGLETGFSHVGGGAGDLSVYAEYYADTRGAGSPLTPFQHDVFIGARYTRNDVNDSVFELRSTYDLDWHSNLLEARFTRRIGGNAVLSLFLIKPVNAAGDPALRGLERDAHLKLGLARYF